MGAWSSNSRSSVSYMTEGDFRSNEQSVTMKSATNVNIVFTAEGGEKKMLKENLALQEGEVIDAAKMSKKALVAFFREQIDAARDENVLFSLHMKATMMKVSDPVIFGHAVLVFFEKVFIKHGELLDSIGVDVNNGFGDLLSKIKGLPEEKIKEIEADIEECYINNPDLAMVNSDKGITNLHVPVSYTHLTLPTILRV